MSPRVTTLDSKYHLAPVLSGISINETHMEIKIREMTRRQYSGINKKDSSLNES